jgi:hypothetical protein
MGGKDWVVELPEDNSEPMKIFLHIIHSQYEQVPAKTGLVELYNILILCEKYEMIRNTRPLAEAWFQPHILLMEAPGNEILMWVA